MSDNLDTVLNRGNAFTEGWSKFAFHRMMISRLETLAAMILLLEAPFVNDALQIVGWLL